MALSIDTQLSYMVQWFNEWSDLQRSDFLPIMIVNYANKAYVNGVVNHVQNMNIQDKPMSLFQCRVKLFNEWLPQWTADNREHFMSKINEIDPEFGSKLQAQLQNGTPHEETNGIASESILED